MNLIVDQEDLLQVLSSTKPVVENAEYVFINEDKIEEVSKRVEQRIKGGLELAEQSFGSTNDYESDAQLVFLEDSVNFCFWTDKDKPKWEVQYPEGSIPTGGWYSLTRCFHRALKEGVPILDPQFISDLTTNQAKDFFRGYNNTRIPLLEERVKNLQETGKVLLAKYDGQFINLLESTNFDAVRLVRQIAKDFNSFQDEVEFNGKKVYFLKRAQIVANDLAYLVQKYPDKKYKT